jgi:hypothetical protein
VYALTLQAPLANNVIVVGIVESIAMVAIYFAPNDFNILTSILVFAILCKLTIQEN